MDFKSSKSLTEIPTAAGEEEKLWCQGCGKYFCLDKMWLRIADGVTIATFGGTSSMWHRQFRRTRDCHLFWPFLLLIIAIALGNYHFTLICAGLDILGAFFLPVWQRCHNSTACSSGFTVVRLLNRGAVKNKNYSAGGTPHHL